MKTVIEMAKEAKLIPILVGDHKAEYFKLIERFASLVREDEREKLKAQYDQMKFDAKMEALQEQMTDAWKCEIAEANFSENTVILQMLTNDYKVSAGEHWLSTTKPTSALAARQMRDAASALNRKWAMGNHDGLMAVADLIDALPVPEVNNV